MKQYFYSNEGVKHGPFTLQKLASFSTSKDIQLDTLIWFDGINDWTPARDLDEFHSILGIPLSSVRPKSEPNITPPKVKFTASLIYLIKTHPSTFLKGSVLILFIAFIFLPPDMNPLTIKSKNYSDVTSDVSKNLNDKLSKNVKQNDDYMGLDLSDAEVNELIVRMSKKLVKNLPYDVRAGITLVGVAAHPSVLRTMTYYGIISDVDLKKTSNIVLTDIKARGQVDTINYYCTQPRLQIFRDNNISIEWNYSDTNNRYIFSSIASTQDCKSPK